MNTLLRRRIMMGLGVSPTPPTPTPTPVTGAYIRNTDLGAYIDTGIAPDNTTKVIVWARNWNPSGGALFGSIDSSSSAFALSAVRNSNNDGKIYLMYGTAGSPYVFFNDAFTKLSNYHKYEYYQGTLYVDDVQVITNSGSFVSNQNTIHLFGSNSIGNVHSNTYKPIDICAAQIYKGGVLVRNYFAVNSPSVGMYDSVTGTLFTNAGSGSFTYGIFDTDAYVPLDYISCTAQQHIDTGIYGSASLPVVVKFRIVGTSVSNPRLLGTYRSGTSGTYFLVNFSNASYPNRYANFYIDSSTVYQMYNNNSTRLTGLDVVFVKNDTSARLLRNGTGIGTGKTFTASSSFSTSPDTIILGAGTNSGTVGGRFNGYIYYAGFGSEGNFVPAKVNGVAGFYETYNDIFYPSETSTPFLAGNEI